MSTRFLNPSRDGDSPAVLGSLVQCLTTLPVKTFFPMCRTAAHGGMWRLPHFSNPAGKRFGQTENTTNAFQQVGWETQRKESRGSKLVTSRFPRSAPSTITWGKGKSCFIHRAESSQGCCVAPRGQQPPPNRDSPGAAPGEAGIQDHPFPV